MASLPQNASVSGWSGTAHGPFFFDGRIYVVARRTTGDVVTVYQSTDNGQTWQELDSSNAMGLDPSGYSFDTTQLDDKLYVLYLRSNSRSRVREFDLSTNSWGSESDDFGLSTVSHYPDDWGQYPGKIFARTDGTLVIMIQGAPQMVMGTNYERIHVGVLNPTNWTFDLDSTFAVHNTTTSYYLRGAVLDPDTDRVHVFYTATGDSLHHKSLSSSNAFSHAVNSDGQIFSNMTSSTLPAIIGASDNGTYMSLISQTGFLRLVEWESGANVTLDQQIITLNHPTTVGSTTFRENEHVVVWAEDGEAIGWTPTDGIFSLGGEDVTLVNVRTVNGTAAAIIGSVDNITYIPEVPLGPVGPPTIDGEGDLFASPSIIGNGQQRVLAEAQPLHASPVITGSGYLSISGQSDLTALSDLVGSGYGVADASGQLVSIGQIVADGEAEIVGLGSLDAHTALLADGHLFVFSESSLKASSELQAEAISIQLASGDIIALSDIVSFGRAITSSAGELLASTVILGEATNQQLAFGQLNAHSLLGENDLAYKIIMASGEVIAFGNLFGDGQVIEIILPPDIFDGAGSLHAASFVEALGRAVVINSGGLNAQASIDGLGHATVINSGSLNAQSALDALGRILVISNGSLNIQTTIDALGRLLITNSGNVETSTALTALGQGIIINSGSLNAQTVIDAFAQAIIINAGQIDAASQIDANGELDVNAVGVLNALSALSAVVQVEGIILGEGTLSAIATIDGVPILVTLGNGTLDVSSQLIGSAIQRILSQGQLVSSTQIVGEGQNIIMSSGQLDALATVIGAGSIEEVISIITASGILHANSSLDASSLLIMQSSGTLTNTTDLFGRGVQIVDNQGTLSASNLVSANGSIIQLANGTITATSEITGQAYQIVISNGTLTTISELVATGQLIILSQGTVHATSSILGVVVPLDVLTVKDVRVSLIDLPNAHIGLIDVPNTRIDIVELPNTNIDIEETPDVEVRLVPVPTIREAKIE